LRWYFSVGGVGEATSEPETQICRATDIHSRGETEEFCATKSMNEEKSTRGDGNGIRRDDCSLLECVQHERPQ
jgi:hypothetical protein